MSDTLTPALFQWKREGGSGGGDADAGWVSFKRHLLVAYYDANRNVKIAIRNGDGVWTYKVLDDQFKGWDSHNYPSPPLAAPGNRREDR